MLGKTTRNGASKDVTPRTSQLRATSTHQLRVRRSRRQRRQGYRTDYVRISTFNHLLSARTIRLNPRAARIRASEIATTLRTRAPGITTNARDTRTRDHDDIRDTRIREHNDNRDTRFRDHHDTRDLRDHDFHDARDRSRDHRSNERPTHEDDRGDSGDMQRNSYHSGMSTSMSRPSLSPKVPTFDGTVSAQFRPWIIQFEAIARHQCWTLGERVVRLVASLTGPADRHDHGSIR